MKKLKKSFILLVVCLLTFVSMFLYGCSASGTYYFEKMIVCYEDQAVELGRSEDYEGVTLSRSAMSLTLHDNNSAVMSLRLFGEQALVLGSWVEHDNNVYLALDGDIMVAEKNGKTLTITYNEGYNELLVIVLKK